jgi:hypothetical protein
MLCSLKNLKPKTQTISPMVSAPTVHYTEILRYNANSAIYTFNLFFLKNKILDNVLFDKGYGIQ